MKKLLKTWNIKTASKWEEQSFKKKLFERLKEFKLQNVKNDFPPPNYVK